MVLQDKIQSDLLEINTARMFMDNGKYSEALEILENMKQYMIDEPTVTKNYFSTYIPVKWGIIKDLVKESVDHVYNQKYSDSLTLIEKAFEMIEDKEFDKLNREHRDLLEGFDMYKVINRTLQTLVAECTINKAFETALTLTQFGERLVKFRNHYEVLPDIRESQQRLKHLILMKQLEDASGITLITRGPMYDT